MAFFRLVLPNPLDTAPAQIGVKKKKKKELFEARVEPSPLLTHFYFTFWLILAASTVFEVQMVNLKTENLAINFKAPQLSS